MSDIKVIFGKNLKRLRMAMDITQEELAERCLREFREATETKRASLI